MSNVEEDEIEKMWKEMNGNSETPKKRKLEDEETPKKKQKEEKEPEIQQKKEESTPKPKSLDDLLLEIGEEPSKEENKEIVESLEVTPSKTPSKRY